MKLLKLFRNLFHKKQKTKSTAEVPPEYPEIVEAQSNLRVARTHVNNMDGILNEISFKTRRIREANIQRRRNTLGHGLRGKFRPRPAFEKKTWNLDRKADED